MKLLHVVDGMDPRLGGVSQAVRTMIGSLSHVGILNEIVCLEPPEVPFLTSIGCPIYALGPGKGPWHYNQRLFPWLVENLTRFDAVIVHGLWLYASYAVRRAAKVSKSSSARNTGHIEENIPKVFIVPHGMLDPYFQRAPGRRVKAIRNWLYWKFVENRVINDADGAFFTCEEECRLAREAFSPYHPKKEVVVTLGVEEPPAYKKSMRHEFSKRCPAVKNHAYLLFLSRIHPKKGVDTLVKAYAEIAATVHKKEVQFSESTITVNEKFDLPKLVIAGPGIETAYGQRLLRYVNKTPGLKNLVLFPGMLSGDAKWGAFYGCDAFVLPSHQENFGIAIVEALACGKPVLISYPVNIWKEIINHEAGLVTEVTYQGILNLLKHWLGLERKAKFQMGRKAKTCYDEKFSLKPATDRFIQALSID